MSKTVLFQIIQFSISTQFSSIWPIDRTRSGSIISFQYGARSDGSEGVLDIPLSSSITGTSWWDFSSVIYRTLVVERPYPLVEKQSTVQSTEWNGMYLEKMKRKPELMWHYVGCPLSRRSLCFDAKPNKGLGSRSRRDQKWAQERRSERSGKKKLREGVGEGWRRGAVDTGQQKRPVGMRQSPGAVREDQSRWVSIPRSFVEISRRMHISVSLQMHRECSVTEPTFLYLS